MRYKLFFLSVSMFFIALESKSQTSETNCLHYPYNTQVGLNLNLNMLSKMRIQQNYYKKDSPSDYIRSLPSFGGDFGVYLYQRVYKWFGMQFGIEYSALTSSCGNTANFSKEKDKYVDYYGFGGFTFPILFNVSYYFNGKHGLDISLGGAPLILGFGDAGQGISVGVYEVDDNNGLNKVGRYKVRLENDTRYNFSLYGKVGYNFLFKNKNTLGVAIVGSYSAEPYAQGYYYIVKNELNGMEVEIERGYTSLRNTFIGLQFSYGFTMKKTLCVPTISQKIEE